MKNSEKRLLVVIWITALLLNGFLLFLYYWPNSKGLTGDENTYVEVASFIYRGVPHEQLPLWPPGYSKFLALFLSLTEAADFPLPLLFSQVAQILLWIVGGIIYWKITAQLLPAYHVRILALSLFILNPTLAAFSHYFWPEILHLTIYLIALWALINYPTSLIWNAVVGVLLGIAALLKLVYYPVSIALMALIFALRFSRKAKLTHALISPVFFFLVLSPTLLHNYKVHNKLMTGDSSIFQIWVGLNDQDLTDWGANEITGRELYYYLRSAQTHNERNEIYWNKIKFFLREQGLKKTLLEQIKKQYFRLFDHRTFFTKQLPGGSKQTYTFSSKYIAAGLRILNDFFWAVTLFGFGIGIMVQWRKKLSWMQLFIMIVLYNLGVFLFFHVKTRYVIQFFPMLCLVASTGLNGIWNRLFGRKPAPDPENHLSWGKIMFGLLLSGLLLILGYRDMIT